MSQSWGLEQLLLAQPRMFQSQASGQISADDPVLGVVAPPSCSAPDDLVQGVRPRFRGPSSPGGGGPSCLVSARRSSLGRLLLFPGKFCPCCSWLLVPFFSLLLSSPCSSSTRPSLSVCPLSLPRLEVVCAVVALVPFPFWRGAGVPPPSAFFRFLCCFSPCAPLWVRSFPPSILPVVCFVSLLSPVLLCLRGAFLALVPAPRALLVPPFPLPRAS